MDAGVVARGPLPTTARVGYDSAGGVYGGCTRSLGHTPRTAAGSVARPPSGPEGSRVDSFIRFRVSRSGSERMPKGTFLARSTALGQGRVGDASQPDTGSTQGPGGVGVAGGKGRGRQVPSKLRFGIRDHGG